MNDLLKKNITDSIACKQALMEDEALMNRVADVANVIIAAFKAGRRIYFCGNGGSAADAQHLAAEFTGPYYNRNRPALPAEALHCNTSYLTAAANDFDFSMVYARLVIGIMQEGDVLVGISTSGNSANIVKAFEAAKKRNITTVGLTGQTGGIMKELSDYLLNVPSFNTPRIQEAQMLLGHTICEMVEMQLFPTS
jgi:D-sedoheptulose 7-phosphate isomerase